MVFYYLHNKCASSAAGSLREGHSINPYSRSTGRTGAASRGYSKKEILSLGDGSAKASVRQKLT